jgi:hypothetical protein
MRTKKEKVLLAVARSAVFNTCFETPVREGGRQSALGAVLAANSRISSTDLLMEDEC